MLWVSRAWVCGLADRLLSCVYMGTCHGDAGQVGMCVRRAGNCTYVYPCSSLCRTGRARCSDTTLRPVHSRASALAKLAKGYHVPFALHATVDPCTKHSRLCPCR